MAVVDALENYEGGMAFLCFLIVSLKKGWLELYIVFFLIIIFLIFSQGFC